MNPNALSPQTPSGAPMERRDFIVSTYKHLGAAILAFVVLSAVLMMTGFSGTAAKMLLGSGNKFIWLGVMGAFMLVGWLASHLADNSDNPQTQLMGLGIYVLAEGLIFAPMFGIAQIVAPGAIGSAAFITLLLVAALTWTAFTSKTDFSFLGGILKVGGLVALGTIIAGAIFGFAKAMGEFGATITFVSNIPGETQTLPALIYTLTQVPGGDAAAMRLTLVSIALSMLALLGSELLAKRIGARRQTA